MIKQASKQSGFTLIELVVVIIILGILAVTAAPRFLSLSSDANKAALQSMGGAIKSAANLVYAKSVIQGLQNNAKTTIDIDADGIDDLEISYGYPSANRNNSISKIMGSGFDNDWTWSTTYGDTRFWLTTASLGGRSGVYVNQTAVLNSGCYILYDPVTTIGSSPKISYVTTDC
ncbi:type II secretion system protein [Shewanella sp. MF05960]|uniref:type II secretion system protein n=1 Tax=Shewanella sp. MF05960 TaxID=3434874 RepID=UPI003D7B85FF